MSLTTATQLFMELWWIPHEGFHFELRVICVPYFFSFLLFFSLNKQRFYLSYVESSSPVSHIHFYIRATLFWDRLGFFRFRFQFREGREILVARQFPFNLTWVWFGWIRRSAERRGRLSFSLSLGQRTHLYWAITDGVSQSSEPLTQITELISPFMKNVILHDQTALIS